MAAAGATAGDFGKSRRSSELRASSHGRSLLVAESVGGYTCVLCRSWLLCIRTEMAFLTFRQLDRICQLNVGQDITAERYLRPDEPYLQDHFPRFPVMPGVLMLETMYQTAFWLIYATDDFKHSVVSLREARNVKYSGFVEPEQSLVVHCELIKRDGPISKLKAEGQVDGRVAVSGRLVLESFNLSEREPDYPHTDAYLRRKMREHFATLCEFEAVD